VSDAAYNKVIQYDYNQDFIQQENDQPRHGVDILKQQLSISLLAVAAAPAPHAAAA